MKAFLVLCVAVLAIAVYNVECATCGGDGGDTTTTAAPEEETTTPAPEPPADPTGSIAEAVAKGKNPKASAITSKKSDGSTKGVAKASASKGSVGARTQST